ncbi:16S rRNA (cytosine(1402)-N(4))-methyltransferase RsmH [Candidatus Spongiihabitans sp.]|uniref:16S rRNA (cytosine(1402)-N(4))-methyltransferase RsmH n=1 Tax=Candidatus Spongiihabitans sp. TaxID=3101308 RepID=UPI003C703C37
MNASAHIPVLLKEVVQALNIPDSKIVVDATYGRGGHARAIFGALASHARLIVIDRDQDAIDQALSKWQNQDRIEIIHAPFSKLSQILGERNLIGKVDALLFDFGVSSPQFDVAERGFSFNHDGPLDMRMDRSVGMTAAAWIKQVEESELIRVLKVFGEERFARRIARRIKQTLLKNQISSTGQLSKLVCEAVPAREKGKYPYHKGHKHPATRTFQAIRIAINQELQEIESVLPDALEALASGGRLVVISFHSLEDRLVKRFFRNQSKGDPYPHDLPVTHDMLKPRLRLVGKPIKPGMSELKQNPRARSAVMRTAQKVA